MVASTARLKKIKQNNKVNSDFSIMRESELTFSFYLFFLVINLPPVMVIPP